MKRVILIIEGETDTWTGVIADAKTEAVLYTAGSRGSKERAALAALAGYGCDWGKTPGLEPAVYMRRNTRGKLSPVSVERVVCAAGLPSAEVSL